MLNIIAAIGKNNELGKNNQLIWHISKDLKFFREKTKGAILVMGRKTFDSLPKILPGREHIILSKTNNFNKELNEQVKIVDNAAELVTICKESAKNNEVFVIGGASLYKMFVDIADKLYITHIDKEDKEADVYFPEIDKNKWNETILSEDEENGIKFSHVKYDKR